MFIKWINSNMCNKGLQFKVGLNTDTLPFSTKGDCVRGGIYYCDFKYVDENGVNRLTIKQGSSRAPGSADPHAEFRDASGQRVDPAGNPVTRKSPGNHSEIDFDL